jgi:integrase
MPDAWHPKRKPLPLSDLALRSSPTGTAFTLMAGPKSSTVVRKLAPGIYSYGPEAYRFFARIRRRLYSLVFRPPQALSLTEAKDAYRQWRSSLSSDPEPHRTASGSFAEDVAVYLSRVTAMPSYQTRKHQLGEWVKALGGERPRSSITATDIERVLQGWLTEGYAIQTVKLRRTDLIQVWAKLDGKRAPNPARETTLPPNAPLEPRDMTQAQVAAVFAAMPDGKAKILLRVLASAGLPHKQIKQLTPADIDLPNRRIRTTARRKGQGAAGGWRPITAEAAEALAAFHQANLYGKVHNSTMLRVFQRACKRAAIPGHRRPYDLRHSFGTWIYDATGDLESAATLLGHAKLDTARRYTLGARQAVAQRATTQVQMPALGAKVAASVGKRVSRKAQASGGSPIKSG